LRKILANGFKVWLKEIDLRAKNRDPMEERLYRRLDRRHEGSFTERLPLTQHLITPLLHKLGSVGWKKPR
jgi:hypothetical protein